MSPVETDCLERIRKGLLRLTPDSRVELFRYRRWYVLKKHYNCCSGCCRYRFRGGYVYANRLMYLLSNKLPIPEGKFIDHVDENKTNDRVENLRAHSQKESPSQGNRIRTEAVLEKLGRWFELVSDLGREPALPNEMTYLEEGF